MAFKVYKNLFGYICILFFTLFCTKNEIQINNELVNVIRIKSVLEEPQKYIGKTITVDGNVYSTEPDKNLFILIDINECDPRVTTCNPASCKVNPLPVTSTNTQLPDKGTRVIVKGNIMKKNGKYTFNCKTIENYNES